MDKMASREHCEIMKMGDRYVLRDLGSSNGTFINGKSLSEKVLEWGDKITIGETVLIFFQDPAQAEGETDVSVTKQTSDETKSLFLRNTEIDIRGASREQEAGEYAHLMYEIGTGLLPKKSPADVCHELIKTVLQGQRFGRAAIVLFNDQGEIVDRYTRMERGGVKYKINLEAGVLRRVFEKRESVHRRSEQVEDMIFSSMIVPVSGPERVLGALYVDDLAAYASLREGELHLLTAAGRLVGHILDHHQTAQRLRGEKDTLRRFLSAENDIIGDSKPIQRVLDWVVKLASTDAVVLLRGESGVGKELLARTLHFKSPRADAGPWIAMNCGSLPPDRIEQELFGFERGAFPGATARRTGRFEGAQGGTLFLDDVSELPPACQPPLLRALDERKIQRIGGVEEVAVDVRVIAATTADLSVAVDRGTFRRDLCDRLRTFEIVVPPLRERPDDIPVLADHFLETFARKMGKRVKGFTEEARALLLRYPWPGNVGELRNAIERALILSNESEMKPEDFASLLGPKP